MSKLAFFNCVSTKKVATEYSLKNIREFYPNAYIMLVCDACESYMDLCEKYDCEYLHSRIKLGYPTQPYGYSISGAIEWITRFYIAALRCNSEYIMMFEDDILITNSNIQLPSENTFFSCTNVIEEIAWFNPEYLFPEQLIKLIEEISGKVPKTRYYGAGGGAIFEVKMIIDNYQKIVNFLRNYGEQIIQYYPYLCWIDCFMTIYCLISGYEFKSNVKICNLYQLEREMTENEIKSGVRFVKNGDWDKIVSDNKTEFDIITHYKKYY